MRLRRCVLVRAIVWIGFFLGSVPGPLDLRAQTVAARLIAQARVEIENINVDSAATLLLEALEPEAGASEAERVRALVLIGIAELSSGMVWGAREAFRQALVLNPSLKIDSLSDLHSKLLQVFSAVALSRVGEAGAQEPQVNDEPSMGGDSTRMRVSGVSFPFPEYMNNLTAQIRQRFQPPSGSASQSLSAEVLFLLRRDGSISNLRFTQRSGNMGFDLAAQLAIEGAANSGAFGPLPDGFQGDILPVNFFFDPSWVRRLSHISFRSIFLGRSPNNFWPDGWWSVEAPVERRVVDLAPAVFGQRNENTLG